MTSDPRARRLVAALLTLLLAAPAWAGSKDTARQHFLSGLDAAEKGDYVLAIGQFMASFDAYPHPTTAFNIAKAYDDKGDLQRALSWYQRFQQLSPSRAGEAAEPILRIREALDPVAAPAPQAAAAPEETKAEEEKPSMADVLKRLETQAR
ncbi:MAG: hypothetical protein H6732_10775 [Alphaproteobacteria bacterium]|nr:hypothetical protein [Alphaproteobacteria bacterium]